jgi:hypothetical protein
MMKGSTSFRCDPYRHVAYAAASLYGHKGGIYYWTHDYRLVSLTEDEFRFRCQLDAMNGRKTRVRVQAGREVIQ